MPGSSDPGIFFGTYESAVMEAAAAWKSLFEGWSDAIPRQGMLVTKTGEPVPFNGFAISGGLLLLERDKPDQYQTRKVILAYDEIAFLRMASTEDVARFQVMGFQATL
jgi:hypothetical protein